MIVKLDDDIMIHLKRFQRVWEKVTKNMLISDSFIMGKRKTCFCPYINLQRQTFEVNIKRCSLAGIIDISASQMFSVVKNITHSTK